MTAGSTKDLQEENSFAPPGKGLPRLLRSAVVYGPNGGGKSNLITGLSFMKKFILTSSKESQEGEAINRRPFLLHLDGPSQASEFEVFFIQEEVRYQYGFAVTEKRVTHEWLFAYPENHGQRWFERSFNPETEEEEWYFGSKFTGSKKTWQDATRANALFLSTAVQLNCEQLKPVFNWFQKLAIIRHGQRINPEFTIESCLDEKSCEEILAFMKAADISVDGIEIKDVSLKNLEFPAEIPESVQNVIKDDLLKKPIKDVFFKHQVSGSEGSISIPLREESDGTQKLFAYAAPWLDVLKNGLVLVVDELDNSFHPHLIRYLLNLIHNSESNRKNGQLIFSTHDTSILDQKLMRRDQVWFVEKDDMGATQLYPLSDFRPRKGEAIEKGYLQGRFGALPYIGEVNF